ncbi:MAG TPA: hypothetical protein VK475_07325, partial [Pyrinomonadaceae bacterium]|nr:hypothetical protein [Pyrinomonadaceae bacterium]
QLQSFCIEELQILFSFEPGFHTPLCIVYALSPDFIRKNRGPEFRDNELSRVARSLLTLQSTKQKGKKAIRLGQALRQRLRGTLGEVLNIRSDGGSFGGTEPPTESKSKRAGLLMDGL